MGQSRRLLLAVLLSLSLGAVARPPDANGWEPAEPVELMRGDTSRAQVALTFDCGPWVAPQYINAILDTLDAYGLRVTFFVTGEFLEKHGELFSQRIAGRHEVANHSYSHPNFPRLPAGEIRRELRWTEELVEQYGVSTRGMWRAPFGARNPAVLRVAADEGYPLHVMWTVDSGDWLPIPAERVKNTVLSRAENGSIFVEHCNS